MIIQIKIGLFYLPSKKKKKKQHYQLIKYLKAIVVCY